MTIKINGKDEKFQDGSTLYEIITSKNLSADSVVCERNGEIVPLEQVKNTKCQDGDEIELLRFVGGG